MPLFTDQTGNSIQLSSIPVRIVSLVPSQTELLFDLGAGDTVTGITKFCIHPHAWFRTKTRVGGTKTVSLQTIRRLQPDLIIANKEENTQEQIEALRNEYPVWVSDISTLDDACAMIASVGNMIGRAAAAENIVRQLQDNFAALRPLQPPIPTAYLIWREPYMTVGHDTFIHDMLTRCGFDNVFGQQTRYPAIGIDQLQSAASGSGPKLLLLSSEPYPFKQQHVDELQQLLPHTHIALADGEMFSWYGSRLLKAAAYFRGVQEEAIGGQR